MQLLFFSVLLFFNSALGYSEAVDWQLSAMIPEYQKVDRQRGVRYFTDKERKHFEVKLVDGLFYDQNGNRLDNLYRKMFVVDKFGRMYSDAVTDTMGYSKFGSAMHHSAYLSGEAVAMAGMVSFENGRLSYIDNNSGHYIPTKDKLINYLTFLSGKQVSLKKLEYSFLGDPVNTTPASPEHIDKLLNPADYTNTPGIKGSLYSCFHLLKTLLGQ